MNWTFKVIHGYPYWCRQVSRTVCRRNVQLMPSLFLKLTKIWQRENGKFVDFSAPFRFEDDPARNAFKYLQMINYCHKLQFAAARYCAGLCLLVITQLCLKVEPSESITASAKTEFYMK